MNLDGIFGNKLIQKTLFGKLEKWAHENNVRLITLPLDANGQVGEPAFYTEDTVTLTRAEYANLIKNQKDV